MGPYRFGLAIQLKKKKKKKKEQERGEGREHDAAKTLQWTGTYVAGICTRCRRWHAAVHPPPRRTRRVSC